MRVRQALPASVTCIKHHNNTDPRIPLNADKRMRMRLKISPCWLPRLGRRGISSGIWSSGGGLLVYRLGRRLVTTCLSSRTLSHPGSKSEDAPGRWWPLIWRWM